MAMSWTRCRISVFSFVFFVLAVDAQTSVPGNDSILAGKTFRVHTLLQAPFVMLREGNIFSGILYDMFQEIGKRAGCTFQFFLQAEGLYGYETNPGEWNGLVGDVHRGVADLAVAPLTITAKRHAVVDFTQPLISDGLRILYAKPQPWANLESLGVILSPFSPGLWVVILAMLSVVTAVFYVIGRFNPYEDALFTSKAASYEGLTVANSLLYTFGSLTWQGYTAAPKSYSGRTLAACWWIFSLLVVTSFTANLAALFLTQEPASLSAPFLTFEELSLQSRVKYGCIKGGATMRYLKRAERTVERRIWEKMQSFDPSAFVQTIEEGVQRVRSSRGDYAFIIEGPLAEQLAARSPCDLVVLGEQLSQHSYGAICDKARQPGLCAELSMQILALHEDNVVSQLRETYAGSECNQGTPGSPQEVFFRGLEVFDSFGGADSGLRQKKAVTLFRFGAPLLILGLGLLLSLALLGGEILFARRRGHAKQPYSVSSPDRESIQNLEGSPYMRS